MSGKVGAVVGAKWNGIKYVRVYVKNVKNPKTPGQLRQRSKFALMGKFIKAVLPMARIGFRQMAGRGSSAFSYAMGYNLDYALTGEYPNFEIDFDKVVLSLGDLPTADSLTVVQTNGGLDFSWDTSTPDTATANDRVMLLAYNPARQRAEYDISSYLRSDGAGSLSLLRAWEGESVQVYAAFASATSELVSNSIYLGSLIVSFD